MNWKSLAKMVVSKVVEYDALLDEKCCALEKKISGGKTFDEKASEIVEKVSPVVKEKVQDCKEKTSDILNSIICDINIRKGYMSKPVTNENRSEVLASLVKKLPAKPKKTASAGSLSGGISTAVAVPLSMAIRAVLRTVTKVVVPAVLKTIQKVISGLIKKTIKKAEHNIFVRKGKVTILPKGVHLYKK